MTALLAIAGCHPVSALAAESAYGDDQPPMLVATAMVFGNDSRADSLHRPTPSEPVDEAVPAELAVEHGEFLVEATLSLTSDFRRGGISSTAGKPAAQASLAVEHRSGLFGSLWASNVANNGGADLELDLAMGYGFSINDLDAQIGIVGYVFPGVRNSAYVELQAGLSRAFGRANISVNAAYSPAQRNIGGVDNIYVGTMAELPLKFAPVTLRGSLGIEDGAFGDGKVDWSLGLNYALWGFDLGADYVDSARTFGTPDSDATVIFSLSRTL